MADRGDLIDRLKRTGASLSDAREELSDLIREKEVEAREAEKSRHGNADAVRAAEEARERIQAARELLGGAISAIDEAVAELSD